ncbi:Uncharacterised protein [Serratia fonticola]|uniref:hypothetical protein n=1 Tax=Serratia fonticola TaxID=47917 RepID=UPI00218378B9|nr:hypothetical protein [Serratia fonticola]CAI2054698.1 Uncharacterised protein [Serratia fonticola]
MKYITAFVLTIFSLSVFAASQCDDNKTIYYGMNIKHTKEVQVCDLGSKISYQFGPVGNKPEIMLVKNKSDVTKSVLNGSDYREEMLYISNGTFTYAVGYAYSADKNLEEYTVNVFKGDIQTTMPKASIKIDKNTVYNSISSSDIPDAN